MRISLGRLKDIIGRVMVETSGLRAVIVQVEPDGTKEMLGAEDGRRLGDVSGWSYDQFKRFFRQHDVEQVHVKSSSSKRRAGWVKDGEYTTRSFLNTMQDPVYGATQVMRAPLRREAAGMAGLDEGFEQAYPIDLARFAQMQPQAHEELPHQRGKVFAYDKYFMFRPDKASEPPLFWASVAEHKKPVFNDNGEVVKMKQVPASPPQWQYFNQLDPDLKKHLGWLPKNERGPKHAPRGAGGGRGQKPDAPGESQFSKPTDLTLHGKAGYGPNDVRLAQQAKQMPEPNWMAMDMPSLMKAYDMASKKVGGGEVKWRAVRERIRGAILMKTAGLG